MALTSEQSAQAHALGFDLSKIDWTKVVQMIQLLIAIFGGVADKKAAVKAVGCPEDLCDCCVECYNAGNLALQAAQKSFGCCHDMCG